MRIVALILRIALGGLFVFAGVTKVIDPQRFATDIHSYQLTSIPVDAAIALYLPWLEIACGACLLLNRWTGVALATLAILMLIFIGVNLYAWAKGLNNECGCFGSLARVSHPWMLVRNMVILTGIVGLALFQRGASGPNSEPQPSTL